MMVEALEGPASHRPPSSSPHPTSTNLLVAFATNVWTKGTTCLHAMRTSALYATCTFATCIGGSADAKMAFGSQAVALSINDAKAKGATCTELDLALANDFEWMVTHGDKLTPKGITEAMEKTKQMPKAPTSWHL